MNIKSFVISTLIYFSITNYSAIALFDYLTDQEMEGHNIKSIYKSKSKKFSVCKRIIGNNNEYLEIKRKFQIESSSENANLLIDLLEDDKTVTAKYNTHVIGRKEWDISELVGVGHFLRLKISEI